MGKPVARLHSSALLLSAPGGCLLPMGCTLRALWDVSFCFLWISPYFCGYNPQIFFTIIFVIVARRCPFWTFVLAVLMSGSHYLESPRLVIYFVLNVHNTIRVSRKTHEKRSIFVTNHSQFKQKEVNVGDVFNRTPPPPPASFFVIVCNERQCICRVFVSRWCTLGIHFCCPFFLVFRVLYSVSFV